MSSHVVQPLSCTLVVLACRALIVKMAGAEHIDENRAEIVAETEDERRERRLREKERRLERWIYRCEKNGIDWQEELDRQAEERRREKEKTRRQRETERLDQECLPPPGAPLQAWIDWQHDIPQKRRRLERLVGTLWPFQLKHADMSHMSLD